MLTSLRHTSILRLRTTGFSYPFLRLRNFGGLEVLFLIIRQFYPHGTCSLTFLFSWCFPLASLSRSTVLKQPFTLVQNPQHQLCAGTFLFMTGLNVHYLSSRSTFSDFIWFIRFYLSYRHLGQYSLAINCSGSTDFAWLQQLELSQQRTLSWPLLTLRTGGSRYMLLRLVQVLSFDGPFLVFSAFGLRNSSRLDWELSTQLEWELYLPNVGLLQIPILLQTVSSQPISYSVRQSGVPISSVLNLRENSHLSMSLKHSTGDSSKGMDSHNRQTNLISIYIKLQIS